GGRRERPGEGEGSEQGTVALGVDDGSSGRECRRGEAVGEDRVGRQKATDDALHARQRHKSRQRKKQQKRRQQTSHHHSRHKEEKEEADVLQESREDIGYMHAHHSGTKDQQSAVTTESQNKPSVPATEDQRSVVASECRERPPPGSSFCCGRLECINHGAGPPPRADEIATEDFVEGVLTVPEDVDDDGGGVPRGCLGTDDVLLLRDLTREFRAEMAQKSLDDGDASRSSLGKAMEGLDGGRLGCWTRDGGGGRGLGRGCLAADAALTELARELRSQVLEPLHLLPVWDGGDFGEVKSSASRATTATAGFGANGSPIARLMKLAAPLPTEVVDLGHSMGKNGKKARSKLRPEELKRVGRLASTNVDPMSKKGEGSGDGPAEARDERSDPASRRDEVGRGGPPPAPAGPDRYATDRLLTIRKDWSCQDTVDWCSSGSRSHNSHSIVVKYVPEVERKKKQSFFRKINRALCRKARRARTS
ncbi:hypothetical protein ACHAWF_004909, partial [Thalassiosira exigua]